MLTIVLTVGLMLQGQVVVGGGPRPAPVPKNAPATLPDTPQAKAVKAYLEAFNSGDEAKFLEAQESLMSEDLLAKRPAADRSKMFRRMRGDFDALKITRAVATAEQIRAVIPDKDGNEAIFLFEFDPKIPGKIKGIGIDIGNVER
jgi:hypothetical protein